MESSSSTSAGPRSPLGLGECPDLQVRAVLPADLSKNAPGAALTEPVKSAMSQYMTTYLDDIAKSSQSTSRGLSAFPPGAVNLSAGDVPALLNTVFPDTDQLRLYKAGVGK